MPKSTNDDFFDFYDNSENERKKLKKDISDLKVENGRLRNEKAD